MIKGDFAPEVTFYGQKAAICFTAGVSRNNDPVINITGAVNVSSDGNPSYEFNRQQLVQLTAIEVCCVLGVISGWSERLEIRRPDGKKYFGIKENDVGSIHCRYVNSEGAFHNIGIQPQEMIRLLDICYSVVISAFPSVPVAAIPDYIKVQSERKNKMISR